jgi:biotin transporter BioY
MSDTLIIVILLIGVLYLAAAANMMWKNKKLISGSRDNGFFIRLLFFPGHVVCGCIVVLVLNFVAMFSGQSIELEEHEE